MDPNTTPYSLEDPMQRQQREADAIRQMLALAGPSAKNEILRGQLAQAQAMRKPSGKTSYGWGAGLFNGLTDSLNSVMGARLQKQAEAQMAANADQKAKASQAYGGVLADMLRERQANPQQQPNPLGPLVGFGLGG